MHQTRFILELPSCDFAHRARKNVMCIDRENTAKKFVQSNIKTTKRKGTQIDKHRTNCKKHKKIHHDLQTKCKKSHVLQHKQFNSASNKGRKYKVKFGCIILRIFPNPNLLPPHPWLAQTRHPPC